MSKVEDIFQINFPPTAIKKDLASWQRGLFSWFGRCNIVKMNTMPHLLYYFQALQIHILGPFLRAVDQALVIFLWAQKPPQHAQSTLHLPKLLGGMVLLDASLYHMVCHMTRVLDWCCHDGPLKQWVQVEKLFSEIPLESLPWYQLDMPPRVLAHPTVGETWRVCSKAFRDLSIAPFSSPLTPIIGNPAFGPGLIYPRFRDLRHDEMFQARHFIVNGHWVSRQQILDGREYAGLSLWQKLQLAHFISSLPSPDAFRRPLTSFELLCQEQSPLRHVVSQTYRSSPPDFRSPYIAKWERDLKLNLTDKQVERIMLFSYKTSIHAKPYIRKPV